MSSGASGSGDDLVSGRQNQAESTTELEAVTPTDAGLNTAFAGTVIFQVSPRESGRIPRVGLDAILGIGNTDAADPGNALGPMKAGTGVVGCGGQINGMGVLGKGGAGSGLYPRENFPLGLGGIGVRGEGGGSGNVPPMAEPPEQPGGPVTITPITQAGHGVYGLGGTQDIHDTNRTPNGAGVVGVAGGKDPLPDTMFGHAGVFGIGGDRVDNTYTVEIDDSRIPHNSAKLIGGPAVPGHGVIGIGGSFKTNNGILNGPLSQSPDFGGAGVVGVASGGGVPPIAGTMNIGVCGSSITGSGVQGSSVTGSGGFFESTSGHGVIGKSDNGGIGGVFSSSSSFGVNCASGKNRGGVFSSDSNAQLRLIPNETEVSPPKGGLAGDFFVRLIKNTAQLWFCVRSRDGNIPAAWKQIA